jgi:RimJ/RimL family protein N-acetyltransferase
MNIEILKTALENILSMRIQFLHENKFQFIHHKCHMYGWADTYLFLVDGVQAGYGSVWGAKDRKDRDCIFEFYLIKPYRALAGKIYSQFYSLPGIRFLEAQTNDLLLSTLFLQHAKNIQPEAILFEDEFVPRFTIDGAFFRKATEADRAKLGKDDSEYIVEYNGEIAATGGLLLNYNMPYADVYMATNEKHRGKGFGTFMVQELKRTAYLMGRVPAARCNIQNEVSKATLLKAGFEICGVLMHGDSPDSEA